LAADRLAQNALMGGHGRRRSGVGEDFWQYRPYQPQQDTLRAIDHRRSGKSDGYFVRQQEWRTAQSLQIWVDSARSMQFSSQTTPSKFQQAGVLALALAIAAEKAGEKVGLATTGLPPARGRKQIFRLADAFLKPGLEEYTTALEPVFLPNARALFISDFLGDLDPLKLALSKAVDAGINGVILQVLDPAEVEFPYRGRAVFQSPLKRLQHDSLQAADLRAQYLQRLAARRDGLANLAKDAGWQLIDYVSNANPISALLQLHKALGQEGRRG
jgi:uncharacterized protein (DUF58 family)